MYHDKPSKCTGVQVKFSNPLTVHARPQCFYGGFPSRGAISLVHTFSTSHTGYNCSNCSNHSTRQKVVPRDLSLILDNLSANMCSIGQMSAAHQGPAQHSIAAVKPRKHLGVALQVPTVTVI